MLPTHAQHMAHVWHVTSGSGRPTRHPRSQKGAQLALYENFIETPTLLTLLFVFVYFWKRARTHTRAHTLRAPFLRRHHWDQLRFGVYGSCEKALITAAAVVQDVHICPSKRSGL